MVEEKQIKDQKLEEKKTEKPVEKIVGQTEDFKEISNNRDKASEGEGEGEGEAEPKEKAETKKEEKITEDKKDGKKSETKIVKAIEGPKKTEAVVNGRDLRISTKHAVAVCNFIRNKNVDKAINELDEVSKMKRAIPMRGEIPHRKGMMSGRYPVNAVNGFLKLLKSVRSNAIMNELEIEKIKIYCMANIATRPYKRFGQRRHKRSHVQIKLIPKGK